jgi:NitT/TauT family transport system permease protein
MSKKVLTLSPYDIAMPRSIKFHPKKRMVQTCIQASTFIIFYLVWDFIVRFGLISETLLPFPKDVLSGVKELLVSGQILNHVKASLYRVAIGYGIAVALAIPFGFFLGWSRSSAEALSPMLEMVRTISPISWIPLAVIWFGIGDNPAIFIIAIASFFPVCIATQSAYLQLPSIILKTATNFGAGGFTLFFKVLLPACLPKIFTGLKISLGIAWMVIVAAEMVGMRSGLGYLVLDARNSLRMDLILSAILIIGVVGTILNSLMNLLILFVVKG